MSVHSVCVLLYGEHLDLAERCLGSIKRMFDDEHVADVRLGLNAVGDDTWHYVDDWAKSLRYRHRTPVLIYRSQGNAMKYPMMRKMFTEGRPLAESVMWFDDDAYITTTEDGGKLFRRCTEQQQQGHRAIGQLKRIRKISPGQIDWIRGQPWYRNREIGRFFLQGSWWCLRTDLLQKLDWPSKWLQHNGGDVMLGRALEQQGVAWLHAPEGVCLNCDNAGRDSGSPRRGVSQTPVGWEYQIGDKPDLSVHDFSYTLTVHEGPAA